MYGKTRFWRTGRKKKMNNLKTITIVFLIISTGIFIRFNNYHKIHPSMDEHFELNFLNKNTLSDIFKRDTMYGDHTSFPGEQLVHYLPMKMMGLFDKQYHGERVKIPYDGWKKNDYLRLVSPKIILYLIGIVIFIKLTLLYTTSRTGLIVSILLYTFNHQLIYHAFELRPYGVLPELAVFNLWFAHRWIKGSDYGNKDPSLFYTIFYFLLVFFTCIYHAYGILIALLPLCYCVYRKGILRPMRALRLSTVVILSIMAWCYYASYSTFGITANTIQKVDDPFRFMPAGTLPIVSNLFGNQILMLIVLPFMAFSLFKKHPPSYYVFLFLMIIFPLIAIIAVDIKTSYWILPRQWVWVMPYFALFCGMSVDGEEK